MIKVNCPNCGTNVQAKDLNISTDIGKCSSCETVFNISESIQTNVENDFDVEASPNGAEFIKLENGFQIIASTRSKAAWFIVPFTLVWAGFSLSAIYGSQLANQSFNLQTSLFGIPFLIGSTILISISLLMLAGKVVVGANGYNGWIFTGVGKIGWTRKFNWQDFHKVEEGLTSFRINHSHKPVIFLQGKTRIGFGMWLNDERRYFIMNCIRKMLSFK